MSTAYSVIIPAYNSAEFIERAVASVLRQSLPASEVIVVDDGSRDSTSRLVEAIRDSRVRLSRRENGGVASARNEGVRLAKSEWVAFLDADDEWHPNFLEGITRQRGARPDVIAIGTGVVHADGQPFVSNVATKDGSVTDYFADAHSRQGLSCLTSSSIAVARDALFAVGLFPEGVTHLEDLDTWMRLAWRGPIGFVDEPLAVYHTEVANSASKRAAANKPPIMLETFRDAAAKGLLTCEQIRGSAGEYVRGWLKSYCRFLAYYGDGLSLRRTLGEFARPLQLRRRDLLALEAEALLCGATSKARVAMQSLIGWPGPRRYAWQVPNR